VIEQRINILSDEVIKNADAICYTSNGITNSAGENIMGRGVALAFKVRFPGIQRAAGVQIKKSGNHVYLLAKREGVNIVSFPTKYNWRDDSDLALIIQSAKELMVMIKENDWKKIYLTRPGVGCGRLDWCSQVKPAIENILDSRVIICSL
jgi:hypothetical protein